VLARLSAARCAALPEKSSGGAMARIKSQGGSLVAGRTRSRAAETWGTDFLPNGPVLAVAGAASPNKDFHQR